MGAAEVDELWARMRAGGAQPDRAAAARLAAAAAPPAREPGPSRAAAPSDAWATLDALLHDVAHATALTDAAPATRRRELERLHALVQVRALPAALPSSWR
jgi:hypothetical protein